MADVRGTLLPVYIVPDQSASMSPVIHEVNNGLVSLLDAMSLDGAASASIRLSIVGFSDNPILHMSLINLLEQADMPTLTALASTSYREIFIDLRQRIQTDVFELRRDNYQVMRPVVFFISDGQPNLEDWRAPLDELKSERFKYHPTIVAYGVSTADPHIINEVASDPRAAFIADRAITTGAALARAMGSIARSIVASAQSAASGVNDVPLSKPAGYRFAIDVLSDD
jgi:uncharacterized protein YegL